MSWISALLAQVVLDLRLYKSRRPYQEVMKIALKLVTDLFTCLFTLAFSLSFVEAATLILGLQNFYTYIYAPFIISLLFFNILDFLCKKTNEMYVIKDFKNPYTTIFQNKNPVTTLSLQKCLKNP